MKRFLIFLILIPLLLLACRKGRDNSARLAEVNGEVLTLEAFQAVFGVEEWEALPLDARKRFVEDWVNLTLLAQSADQQGLNKDLALQQKINFAAKKVKANALIAQRLAEVQVSEDQLFSYFRIHQAEFQKPAVEYQIQRIQVPDKLTAERVLMQLNQGMDFDTAVSRYSTEPLKDKKGIMGFVSVASADSSFWYKARDLQKNEPGVVSKAQLWYVFRYTDQREMEGEANFEDFRAEIKRRIILEKQEEVYQSLLREIKAQTREIYYY
ncbi:MAG TPA: peptidylprolyl isomerase [Candidatus Cloacimonadota bacterium]|nr:peptidylprolyl isomerase [Candidatus Cloacimonadota bacterium]